MRGIVAAGHEAAADAAAAMLDAGGNAFDAVIAAGFASTVCEPGFTSLAGGGFLLARTADGNDAVHDFFVDTPGRGRSDQGGEPAFEEVSVTFAAATQTFHCGPGSVAVPGVLAGFLHVHDRLCVLPLADVVAPAVRLATGGVRVSPSQALDFELLAPILARTPASREVFFRNGRLLTTDDTLHNPALGQYLERLGRDPGATFYRGEGARRLARQLGDQGGLLTEQDLAAYRVIERAPLRLAYRGRTLLTNPPPTFGGALLGAALARLDHLPHVPPAGSPELAVALARTMARVDAERGATGPVSTRGTTHVSVADADGNVAAMTTSNGECSGDVIDGTGISCNNMLGEDDLHPDGFHGAPPGQRVASMMSPTFVLAPDDRAVALALGSGGSKRIRSALLQVLVATLDHGLDLDVAVSAPRIHWDEDHLEVEPGLGDDTLAALRSLARTNVWPDRSMYFGGVHAVEPGLRGVGDPRRGGAVRVV